jgi:hypothetical protein
LNAGVTDLAARRAETTAFQRAATAAAAADKRWKAIADAANAWAGVQADPTSLGTLDVLRQAIDNARAACSGVPAK